MSKCSIHSGPVFLSYGPSSRSLLSYDDCVIE